MPKFSFTAVDANGKERTGVVEAATQELASSQIKTMGLYPTNITSDSAKTGGRVARKGARGAMVGVSKAKKPLVIGSVINQKGLTVFTRQLATLIQAGLPLLRALEVLERQEKNVAFKWVLGQLAENIRSGNTFSEGLQQHPKVFNRLFINMVKAGEAGGVLDVVLNRLARFMEKALRIKGKVKSAMVYPVIIFFVAMVIMAGLLMFVVPQFESIFEDMLDGAELPGLTQFVLGTSDFVRNNIFLTIGILIALYIVLKVLKKTRRGARIVDWSVISMPPIGDLFRKAAIARFSRTLGTLLSSGVPILQALNITRDTSGNTILMDAIDDVHDRVKEGEGVAGPLERTKVFPTMVTSMIEVGEETGELPEMLNRVADTYDEEVDNAVAGLTSIIEPIMIVFLAIIVGTIVIALFLPIVKIIQELS
ncbi:MAG: type II secretion system F family protein [Puniceicoccaceae bacterium]|nr:MAG: type II secretion system F family protein [Puniceicoccaceae bacterium]